VYGKSTLLEFTTLIAERYGYWVEWDILHMRGAADWCNDKLVLSGYVLDMFLRRQGMLQIFIPMGISMHLVERVFQRLNTTEHQKVLNELTGAALVAAALAPVLVNDMPPSDDNSLPLMLPTPHGAILGDLEVMGAVGMLHFKTFLGGEDDISPVKRKCLSALADWNVRFNDLIGLGFELAFAGISEIPQDDVDLQLIRGMTKEYCEILNAHRGALGTADERAQRQQGDNALWRAARGQQRAEHQNV